MSSSRAHEQQHTFPDNLPSPVKQFLRELFEVDSFPELRLIALQAKQLLKKFYLLAPPPAPQITSPSPGGFIAPNTFNLITLTTNEPDLDHELCLIPKPPLGIPAPSPASHINIPAPGTADFDALISVPPGASMEYYLEVGVHADALEQQRHRIRVRTPAQLVGTITGNPPPNPLMPPYMSPLNVTFTVQFNGGMPPYNYTILWGDGNVLADQIAPDSNPINHAHTYNTAGVYLPYLIYTDSITPFPLFAPGGEYHVQ
ncbi:MAG: hypothetical protein L0241_24190 [Planctomycetia bacterium]|nr:hypothetical protein [Planctomycetia bacterium]